MQHVKTRISQLMLLSILIVAMGYSSPPTVHAQGSVTTILQGIGFAGEWMWQENTSSTSIVHLRARAYTPSNGRFLQRDPFAGFVDDPQSQNRSYYTNNPANWVDPTGNMLMPPLLTVRYIPPGPPEHLPNVDQVQNTLDVAGLVPGIGEPADAVNGGISLVRGKYGDAALSLCAMIPVAGSFAPLGKAGKLTDFLKGKNFKLLDAHGQAIPNDYFRIPKKTTLVLPGRHGHFTSGELFDDLLNRDFHNIGNIPHEVYKTGDWAPNYILDLPDVAGHGRVPTILPKMDGIPLSETITRNQGLICAPICRAMPGQPYSDLYGSSGYLTGGRSNGAGGYDYSNATYHLYP